MAMLQENDQEMRKAGLWIMQGFQNCLDFLSIKLKTVNHFEQKKYFSAK